jgi:hypothetical protein
MGGGGSRPAPSPPYNPCNDWSIPLHHYNVAEYTGKDQGKGLKDQALRHVYKREGRSWNNGYQSCVFENGHIDRSYYRDKDTYLDSRFVFYNPNGSMKWCQLRNYDKGWDYKNWNIRNTRDFYNYCKFYDLAVPAIRGQAGAYVPPRLTSGTSTMDIGAKDLTATDLGNVSGNVDKITIPEGWAVRIWSGLKFDGMSIDYTTPGEHNMGSRSSVRSLQISPMRPVVMSGTPHAQSTSVKWTATLRNDEYRFVDINDGTFAASYYYNDTAKIQQVLVPIGYQLTLYSGDGFTGTKQTIHGHNTNGWVAANFAPKSLYVKVIVPVTFSKSLYSGFPTGLIAGKNAMDPSRQVASIRVPNGVIVTGRSEGAPTRQMRGDLGSIDKQYQILEVKVEYNTRSNANVIDDMPVRTETIYSKVDFAKTCQKTCDTNVDCAAYYAVKMMRECPNPVANDGQTEGGCKNVCGYYENQWENIRFGDYKNVEPYLFEGNVHVKKLWSTTPLK